MFRGKFQVQQREENSLLNRLKWITLLGVRGRMQTMEWPLIPKQIIRKVRFVGPGQVRLSSKVKSTLRLETI